uniref:Amino acid transporter transmembrane domain-containing protein n=1 Tax=Pygocentrus nattereri TaxID=42514 RepID=A0A3B4D7E7_PYGNA
MELKPVSTEADDDSMDERYSMPIDSEKTTMNSQYMDEEDAESQKFLANGMKKKKFEEEYHPGHASFGMSAFNLSNAIMGSGILGLSFAMANTVILPLSLFKNLGYLGYTSGFSLSCMVFFVGVLIYKKTQLPCPLPFFYNNSSGLSLNGSAPLGPQALHNSSALMEFSRADMSSVHLDPQSPAVAHSGVHYIPHPDDYEDMCTPKYFVFNSQTAYTIPILAFAFVCHPEVLPIYSELKDRSRRKMQNVSNISILAMLVMYMLSALFGYLTFYENVEAELLHTFTKVYKFDTMLLLVRLAVLTAVTLTVPIVLFPVSTPAHSLVLTGLEPVFYTNFVGNLIHLKDNTLTNYR